MTTFSLRLLAPPEDDAELTSYAYRGEVLADLHKSAPDFSPTQLSKWAAEQNLVIRYVDNSWLRVVVESGQLRDFIQYLGLETQPDVQRCVIEAEEF